MKNKMTLLLAATAISFLAIGQVAVAGEGAPRDEYSIGVVWNADYLTQSDTGTRVNFLLQERSNKFGTGEKAPRDEYSMPVVWDTNYKNDSRVNYSIQRSDGNSFDSSDYFPDYER